MVCIEFQFSEKFKYQIIRLIEGSPLERCARRLVEVCNAEINNLIDCNECYANIDTHPDTWFSQVCSKAHLIVWARAFNWPYWPAKVMSVDGPKISIQFFGDQSMATITADKCYLYSKENPIKITKLTLNAREYQNAIAVR